MTFGLYLHELCLGTHEEGKTYTWDTCHYLPWNGGQVWLGLSP